MSCCDVCGFIRTLFSKSGATRQMLLPLIKKDASAKQSQQYQVAHSITACRPWNNNLESVEFSSIWFSQNSIGFDGVWELFEILTGWFCNTCDHTLKLFQTWNFLSFCFMNLVIQLRGSLPERIYNPITAMGFSAMFTFQLDNTKK